MVQFISCCGDLYTLHCSDTKARLSAEPELQYRLYCVPGVSLTDAAPPKNTIYLQDSSDRMYTIKRQSSSWLLLWNIKLLST